MKKTQALCLLLFLVSCTSQAAIITFDDITLLSNATIPGGYQGYAWVGYDPFTNTVGSSVPVSTGNDAVVSGAYSLGSTLGFQMSRVDGMAFNVVDFHAAYDIPALISDLTLSGYRNGALIQQITTGTFSDTPALIPVNFPDIDLFRIETTSFDIFSIDNLGITAAPVPPAFYLFGSGLLGLIGISRRRMRCYFNHSPPAPPGPFSFRKG